MVSPMGQWDGFSIFIYRGVERTSRGVNVFPPLFDRRHCAPVRHLTPSSLFFIQNSNFEGVDPEKLFLMIFGTNGGSAPENFEDIMP